MDDLVVVGNSMGGWIAVELAFLRPHGFRHLILIDAVGIDVPGRPVTDVSGMAIPQSCSSRSTIRAVPARSASCQRKNERFSLRTKLLFRSTRR